MIALVIAGGPPPERGLAMPVADLVIVADSGLDIANTLGLAVDVVVGDMDSVTPEALARAEAEGVDILRHPADKDETDLALAMVVALDRGADRIVVAAATGGRLDHFLANISLLASEHFRHCQVELIADRERAWVVRGSTPIDAARGTTITLLPVGGDALGVTTAGMRWELADETLAFGSSRGVSNVANVDNPTVAVTGGVLLAIAVDEV